MILFIFRQKSWIDPVSTESTIRWTRVKLFFNFIKEKLCFANTPTPNLNLFRKDEGIVSETIAIFGDVPFSRVTSATLVVCYIYTRDCSRKREEGGDDVKSAWLLHSGQHTCYNGVDNGSRNREVEPIPSNNAPVRIAVCNSTA